MSDISINYIIATYDGFRGGCGNAREKHDNESGHVLQKHMKVLVDSLKTTKYIKQVTLLRNHDPNGSYKEYYEINEYIEKIAELGIHVIILEPTLSFICPYEQYIYMCRRFSHFDFNILMEDDWVPFPGLKGFDQALLDEYKKYNNRGFLSAWAPKKYRCGSMELPYHAAISVGIVSHDSMNQACKDFTTGWGGQNGQLGFCSLFNEIYDYSDSGNNYMIPFWETGSGAIWEFASKLSKKYLLVPIQLLDLNKYKYIVGPYETHLSQYPPKEIFEWVQRCNDEGEPPKNFIRELVKSDYERYSKLIDTNITRIKYDNFVDSVLGSNHEIVVQEYNGELVATGTLLIEEKMTHGGCKMGHIENIFVDSNYRKMEFGEKIVNELLTRSENKKCYRVDLNCNSELESFYEKMDLKQKHICMNIYFEKNFN